MKMKSLTLVVILLGVGITASAQDVFMATSEDLKEFDKLIAQDKNAPPPQAQPANAATAASQKKKQYGQRERFQGNRPDGDQAGPRPGFQQPPPAGTEPGGNGLPPPPPPPPRH